MDKPKSQNLNLKFSAAAVVLPFLLFFAASVVNPNGYMSTNPLFVLVMIYALAYQYWPVTIGLVVAFVLAALIGRRAFVTRFLAPIIFLMSLLFSIWLFYAVSTAPEQEFTD